MPFFECAPGVHLHYVVDDYTDPWKNAPCILLQHGNGRSGAFWYSWMPYLSRFYRVVRPDMRGLGKSSADFDLKSEFTLEHCVEDLVTIIDDLGVQSVHVCGESAGDPLLALVLAGLGVSSLSMAPSKVPVVRLAVAQGGPNQVYRVQVLSVASRAFGYAGIALYEALVPGMAGFTSLGGVLAGLDPPPAAGRNRAYDWPSVANAAFATVLRGLFPPGQAAAIDALEARFEASLHGTLPPGVFDRSIRRGQDVGVAVVEWSKGDGGHEGYLHNFPSSYAPPVGAGLWAPTPPGGRTATGMALSPTARYPASMPPWMRRVKCTPRNGNFGSGTG